MARLWDVKAGEPLATLQGHTGDVVAVSFSPDGTRVATASEDGTAHLWDASTGEPLAVLRGHHGAVRSVVFSPDGRHVATASIDGTARIWAATPEGFLIQACQYLRQWHADQGVEDIVTAWVDKTP